MSFSIKDEESPKCCLNEEYFPLIQHHNYDCNYSNDYRNELNHTPEMPYFRLENDYAPNIDHLTLNDIMRHENISYDKKRNMEVPKGKDTIVPIPEDTELCFRKQSGLESLASKYFIPKSLGLQSFLNPLKHAKGSSYNSNAFVSKSIDCRQLANKSNHYFIALDLDECSLLGGDTNGILELGFVARRYHDQMPRYTDEKMQEEYFKQRIGEKELNKLLLNLAENVVNPALINAMSEIKKMVGHQPYLFAYTNKVMLVDEYAAYLDYYKMLFERIMNDRDFSLCNAQKTDLMEWFISQHYENEVFPVASGGYTMFLEGASEHDKMDYLWKYISRKTERIDRLYLLYEKEDMVRTPSINTFKCQMIKLGLSLWTMSQMLKLPYHMPVFISKVAYKDLNDLLSRLGCTSTNKMWLYDDRSNTHLQQKIETVYGNDESNARKEGIIPGDCCSVHMIQVQPYTSHIMPMAYRHRINKILNQMIPVPELFFSTHKDWLTRLSIASIDWSEDKLLFLNKDNHPLGKGGIFLMGAASLHDDDAKVPRLPWPIDIFNVS